MSVIMVGISLPSSTTASSAPLCTTTMSAISILDLPSTLSACPAIFKKTPVHASTEYTGYPPWDHLIPISSHSYAFRSSNGMGSSQPCMGSAYLSFVGAWLYLGALGADTPTLTTVRYLHSVRPLPKPRNHFSLLTCMEPQLRHGLVCSESSRKHLPPVFCTSKMGQKWAYCQARMEPYLASVVLKLAYLMVPSLESAFSVVRILWYGHLDIGADTPESAHFGTPFGITTQPLKRPQGSPATKRGQLMSSTMYNHWFPDYGRFWRCSPIATSKKHHISAYISPRNISKKYSNTWYRWSTSRSKVLWRMTSSGSAFVRSRIRSKSEKTAKTGGDLGNRASGKAVTAVTRTSYTAFLSVPILGPYWTEGGWCCSILLHGNCTCTIV